MKRAYIIHGWGGSSKEPLLEWIKEELQKKGYSVKILDMPHTDAPKIEEWVEYLKKEISSEEIDEDSIFIGHSIGCQTIMRFLEKLHKHKKVGKCIFIAPWIDLINLEPDELEIAHPWINTKIDFDRILDHCTDFVCIFSNNDPYVHLDEAEKFKEKLNAKIVILKNKGHFTEKYGIEKLPEILDFLK